MSDGTSTTLTLPHLELRRVSKALQQGETVWETEFAGEAVQGVRAVELDAGSYVGRDSVQMLNAAAANALGILTDADESSGAASKNRPRASHRQPAVESEDWTQIYKYARAVTGNSADAEDAVQEAYLRLFQEGARGSKIDSPTAWLVRVARNVLFRNFRKFRPDMHQPLDAGALNDEGENPLADLLVDPDESIEDRVIFESLIRHSLRIISQLPEKEKRCVLMYANGDSFVEISKSLGISYKVAITTTRKALVKVRDTIVR